MPHVYDGTVPVEGNVVRFRRAPPLRDPTARPLMMASPQPNAGLNLGRAYAIPGENEPARPINGYTIELPSSSASLKTCRVGTFRDQWQSQVAASDNPYVQYQSPEWLDHLVGCRVDNFAQLSPGSVLLYLLIRDLIAHDPPRLINFGVGDAEYKRTFRNLQAEDVSLVLFRKTLANIVRRFSHETFASTIRAIKARRERSLPSKRPS